jgi:hypothetical protein
VRRDARCLSLVAGRSLLMFDASRELKEADKIMGDF